jgi:hypothetical protein
MSIDCCRDYSETNQRHNRPGGRGRHAGNSETSSMREIIYERSMAEANDDICSTEPSLPGAIAWIRRNWKSAWIFGTMDLDRCLLWQWTWVHKLDFREEGLEDARCIWRFPSLHFTSLLFTSYWISAQYKWRRHRILPPTTGGGVSPCTRSTEQSPLNSTNR